MNVLVFEYITGSGLRGERLPAGLLREGSLMLEAAVGDLLAETGVSVTVLRDDRLPALPAAPRLRVCPVPASRAFGAVWRAGLAASDAVWPIAPECGGVLEGLCRDVERAGKRLLNTPCAGVRLAASKFETAARLARHGVPAVPTWRWGTAVPPAPFVVKPDDGVGCEGARVVDRDGCLPEMGTETTWVVQPLVEGESLSLSVLFSSGRGRLLSCNRQVIERVGNGFVLRACQVNALHDEDGRWQSLADDIARAVPELWGYAGVDVVLGPQGPKVLEINPRLTTSYAGLHRALGINPARLLLELARSGALPGTCMGRESVEISLEHGVAE